MNEQLVLQIIVMVLALVTAYNSGKLAGKREVYEERWREEAEKRNHQRLVQTTKRFHDDQKGREK